jgi:cytochrome P460
LAGHRRYPYISFPYADLSLKAAQARLRDPYFVVLIKNWSLKMKIKFITVLLGVLNLVIRPVSCWENTVAVPAEKDSLPRPENYREWIFVGSSLGLRYDERDEKQNTEELEYKNIYINPSAYRDYMKTGKFPQGTMLVLEIAKAETKKEPGLRGSYQKEFVGLLAAVKDRERFGDEWAYFRFTDKDGKLVDEARPFPKASCFNCHQHKAADDNVFTQFYPVLKAAKKK